MNRTPLFWIAALVVALVAGWQLASAQGEKERGVQKWEYKVLSGSTASVPGGNLLKQVAELGDAGWELVAVEPATRYSLNSSNQQSTERVFHFKRPK